MTEFEMFKKIFSDCSIWRGGSSDVVDDGRFAVLPVHIAVRKDRGLPVYLDLRFVFDKKDGKWLDTIKEE